MPGVHSVSTRLGRLQSSPLTLALVEATEGYEAPIVAALVAAALPVAVVNPRQVRDFANAPGQVVRRSLDTHIRWLEHQVIDTDVTLEAAIQASPVWRVQD